ncbi:MAG TPA: molybdopterin-dependent oxidoreductase [Arachnia sp.]|nr:molybdopterin-dependent oxidoreductase [Arachnia sp.]HMT86095.1 molybdopterin-dependent oxidoreductase [Arachnia sp.]
MSSIEAPAGSGSSAESQLAIVAGIAAAVAGLGVGELVAGLVAAESSPLTVVGALLIDVAPSWAKDLMIFLFGTADKVALIVLVVVGVLALAALAGYWQHRRGVVGAVAAVLLGAAVAGLAVAREDAGAWAWVPSTVAGIVAGAMMSTLVRRIPRPNAHPSETPAPSRRRFLTLAGATAAAGILAAAGGAVARGGRRAVSVVRDAIRLPRAAMPAPPIPADADLRIDGLSPLVTPNGDFYRIDTALVVPSVAPEDWELRVHGLVEHELRVTWEELLSLPLTESAVTLSCVSNEVGGNLVGNAVWLGYPIRELLARAKPLPEADMVLSRSVDGFTAGTPLSAVTDGRDALLAVGMNGEPLPPEHGSPVRMVVPGLYGYVSATKWVIDLEVTRFDRASAYWTVRGWSERGPVKLQSRIDVPRAGTSLDAGDAVIAGVAWHPHTGISAVQVQIDDGPWVDAELGWDISADTWVQWRTPWQATAGTHRIRCRAVSREGSVQTDEVTPVAPDGATGRHTIEVRVA